MKRTLDKDPAPDLVAPDAQAPKPPQRIEPVLWTLQEAAAAVQVSPNYLRDSDCHRVFLPSLKAGGRPLLRFLPADVQAWAESHSTRRRTA